MNGDLKATFIRKVLNEYGAELEKTMRQVMTRMKVNDTGAGMQSIGYRVLEQQAGGEMKLSFNEYLRFIDMGVGRAHPLGGLTKKKVELKAQNKTGMIQVKDRVRRPRKFYSKIAYGKLGWMYGKLLYGYTEETITMLKAELEGKAPTNNN